AVTANVLSQGTQGGNASALASADIRGHRRVRLDGNETVNAHAVSSGTKAVTALAQGNLQGSAVNAEGNIAFTASALGIGHTIDDAIAIAGFSAEAAIGGILLQNNILVHANAVDPGTGNMLALGFADLHANSGITVDGDITINGDLTGNGLA